MGRDTNIKTFDVVFEGRARSSGKLRCDLEVDFVTTGERFELATDEGRIHGGENTAPPPLALFTGALSACLMTQIRAFAKRLGIPVKGVEIRASLHWRAEQTGREPYAGTPVSFDLDVDIDSDAGEDALKRLLAAAQKGCFVEATLAQGVPVGHRLRIGDDWVRV